MKWPFSGGKHPFGQLGPPRKNKTKEQSSEQKKKTNKMDEKRLGEVWWPTKSQSATLK